MAEEPESESFEVKSVFCWGRDGQEFDLAKTIVAFANRSGGTISIDQVEGEIDRLDSARLDDFLGKYFSPRVPLVTSRRTAQGGWEVQVGKSPAGPHVVKQEGSYEKNGKRRSAFYPGQVYVRHGSKSEPATGEYLQGLIREGISSVLSELGNAYGREAFTTQSGHGLPVRIVSGGPALGISVLQSHMYTAADIGSRVSKTGAWIGKLVNTLGLRDDPAYCIRVPGGGADFYRYTALALERIERFLSENPDFNPYR